MNWILKHYCCRDLWWICSDRVSSRFRLMLTFIKCEGIGIGRNLDTRIGEVSRKGCNLDTRFKEVSRLSGYWTR